MALPEGGHSHVGAARAGQVGMAVWRRRGGGAVCFGGGCAGGFAARGSDRDARARDHARRGAPPRGRAGGARRELRGGLNRRRGGAAARTANARRGCRRAHVDPRPERFAPAPDARTPQGQWVRVIGGWSPAQFAERRMPTLDELNAAAPDTPVFVLHLYSRGMLNRAGLRALGITADTKAPPGGRFERGPD